MNRQYVQFATAGMESVYFSLSFARTAQGIRSVLPCPFAYIVENKYYASNWPLIRSRVVHRGKSRLLCPNKRTKSVNFVHCFHRICTQTAPKTSFVNPKRRLESIMPHVDTTCRLEAFDILVRLIDLFYSTIPKLRKLVRQLQRLADVTSWINNY